MKQQDNNQSYEGILKELDIPLYNDSFHSKSININKDRRTSIKTHSLQGMRFIGGYAYLLRYREGIYYIQLFPLFSTNTEKGGFNEVIDVTTNKY